MSKQKKTYALLDAATRKPLPSPGRGAAYAREGTTLYNELLTYGAFILGDALLVPEKTVPADLGCARYFNRAIGSTRCINKTPHGHACYRYARVGDLCDFHHRRLVERQAEAAKIEAMIEENSAMLARTNASRTTDGPASSTESSPSAEAIANEPTPSTEADSSSADESMPQLIDLAETGGRGDELQMCKFVNVMTGSACRAIGEPICPFHVWLLSIPGTLPQPGWFSMR